MASHLEISLCNKGLPGSNMENSSSALVTEVLSRIVAICCLIGDLIVRVYSPSWRARNRAWTLLYSALHSFIGCCSWRNLSPFLSLSLPLLPMSLFLRLSWMKFGTRKRCVCLRAVCARQHACIRCLKWRYETFVSEGAVWRIPQFLRPSCLQCLYYSAKKINKNEVVLYRQNS